MTDYLRVADKVMNDPRISRAKQLMKEAIQDHQKEITTIKPANPALKQSYDELLDNFAQQRGAKLWYPYLGSGFGHGAYVELFDGSVKLDMITGIGVQFMGHGHPAIREASIDAAITGTIMQGNLQQNADSVELSQLLTKLSGLPHCFLSSSGAMAVENGIKIALQKNQPANRILAFEHCFAGRTWSNSQITDKPAYREGLPLNISVDYVPFYDPAHPEESTKAAVDTLKKHIARYPKMHAVMIFELVQGEAGFYVGSHDFFKSLMEILREHHIAVMADEVQTFGRLPKPFAFHYFELMDWVDIVTIGKMTQACATLFNQNYCPRPGLLSQTFTGSTAAIRASTNIINTLINEGFYGEEGKNAKLHSYFELKLIELSKKHSGIISGPYGIGAMIAFTPFGGDSEKVVQFARDLFDAGLIVFVAGANPTRIRMLIPAAVLTEADIDLAIKILDEVLSKR